MQEHKRGDVVFHTKKHFIGYITSFGTVHADVDTPKGVVRDVNRKNLVLLTKALRADSSHREAAYTAVRALPVGSVGVDDSGDVWVKKEEGWDGLEFQGLTLESWFSDSPAKLFPAIPETKIISKKEASCVES